MRWSLQLGAVRGIGIHIHATFLLLVIWVGMSHWQAEQTAAAVLGGITFVLLLFGCIVLHELGHALTAARYGIRTRDITLLPIGGVARLERMPEDPRQELWVALAGPAVNVVIAAGLLVWLFLRQQVAAFSGISVGGGSLAARLLVANLILVVFNMLPAFPMDGGRVVRALLAIRMDYDRATRIAAGLGQAMAILFGGLGLLYNPFLLFIAFFVWIGATQEASATHMRSALGGIPVGQAMVTHFETLAPGDTLAHAVARILNGSQHDFPVVEAGSVVGILTRNDLLGALASERRGALVGDVMTRDFQVVDGYEMLQTAFEKLQAGACHTLPVVRHGRLIGLVTQDNLGEFLMIRSALDRGGRTRPPPLPAP